MDFANDEVERVRRAHQVIMAKEPVFKTFHVIGMIFSDVILGWYYDILGHKFVNIIGKQTS